MSSLSNGTPSRVFVKSFGCQMNVYDSQRMTDVALAEGFTETGDIDAADMVIYNTCHIRERASEKLYSELGKVREVKEARASRGLSTKLVVAGCVAQAEGAEMLRRQSAIDVVVGPQNYHRLPELLRARSAIVDTDFAVEDKFERLPPSSSQSVRARGVSAFVTVQEGCDKFCAFCVVPYTRGAEISRPAPKILSEIARLADAGAREFTLIGQNVNAFRGSDGQGGSVGLAELLETASALPGVERLRYSTSHPIDMDEALIIAHRDLPKLAPHLHLPVQSGADRVLNAMNRRHTVAEYLGIVDRARRARPDIAFSSDFIVGFPGETDAEFEATMALVRKVGFASSFAFKYSTRPGTPAADAADQIAAEVMDERLARLQALLDSQRKSFNAATVGRRFGVIFDKPGRYPGQLIGRSPYMQGIYAEASADCVGRMTEVEVLEAGPNALRARLAAPMGA